MLLIPLHQEGQETQTSGLIACSCQEQRIHCRVGLSKSNIHKTHFIVILVMEYFSVWGMCPGNWGCFDLVCSQRTDWNPGNLTWQLGWRCRSVLHGPDEIRTSLEAMEGFYGCTSCDLGRLGKWLKGDKKAGRWLTGYFNVLSQTGVGHLITERLHGESVSRNAQVRDFAVCSGGNCPCATFGQSSGMRRRYQGRWQSKLSCSTSWGKVFAIVSPLVV